MKAPKCVEKEHILFCFHLLVFSSSIQSFETHVIRSYTCIYTYLSLYLYIIYLYIHQHFVIDLSAGGGKRAGGGSSHCFGRSLEGLGSRFREFGGRPLLEFSFMRGDFFLCMWYGAGWLWHQNSWRWWLLWTQRVCFKLAELTKSSSFHGKFWKNILSGLQTLHHSPGIFAKPRVLHRDSALLAGARTSDSVKITSVSVRWNGPDFCSPGIFRSLSHWQWKGFEYFLGQERSLFSVKPSWFFLLFNFLGQFSKLRVTFHLVDGGGRYESNPPRNSEMT